MEQPQLIFERNIATKKKIKDIRQAFKDALNQSEEYQEIKDKMTVLNQKKNLIVGAIKRQFSSEITKLEDLTIDEETNTELLTDVTWSRMMKGENVEVTDEYGNTYEPIIKIKFKKK